MVKPHERVRITIHDLLTEAEVDQVIVRAQGLLGVVALLSL